MYHIKIGRVVHVECCDVLLFVQCRSISILRQYSTGTRQKILSTSSCLELIQMKTLVSEIHVCLKRKEQISDAVV